MVTQIDISHDSLRRFITKRGNNINEIRQHLLSFARKKAHKKRGRLIFDDTQITKEFSKMIEGLTDDYNSISGRITLGLSVVVMCLVVNGITIPVDFRFWFAKDVVGEKAYKTKSELSLEMVEGFLMEKIDFSYVLFGGLYFCEKVALKLKKLGVIFECRAHSNRVIEGNGERNQLKNHSALKGFKKNKRFKTVSAIWRGVSLQITAHKRKSKHGSYTVVYQASNQVTSAKEHIRRYEERWKIEMAFRSMKQRLGIKGCTARSIHSQSVHVASVFTAYLMAQIAAKKYRFSNADTFLRAFRNNKIPSLRCPIPALRENFHVFA